MSLGCRFPDLYGTDGCCMCGNPDLQACPCTAIGALRHQETAHQNWDASRGIRALMGCPLDESVPPPSIGPNEVHSGLFEAPCGHEIVYFTPLNLPSLAHYRWHTILDHMDRGECRNVDRCRRAVEAGTV